MTINGVVTPVGISEWANIVLTPEQLTEFNSAVARHNANVANVIANGSIVKNELAVTNTITAYWEPVQDDTPPEALYRGTVAPTTVAEVYAVVLNQPGSTDSTPVTWDSTSNAISYSGNGTLFTYEETVSNGVKFQRPDSLPWDINLNDPVWSTYWERFTSDANVTFPAVFGSETVSS
jgi:hypothetical protein